VDPADRDLVRAAADRLDALAARTTSGRWTTTGLLATRPEVVAHLPGGGTEHVAEARARTAEWVVTASPALAAPLAHWLRTAADDPAAGPEALAVARVLTGRRDGAAPGG
jgi:hypothetical protein